MKPKVIKTQAEREAALARIARLMESDPPPGTPAGDELELLAALAERYEEKPFPIELPSPLDAIRFRMEQQNLRPKDLAPYLGGANRVSEVLSGKRALTVGMIQKLHQELGIPAEVLVNGSCEKDSRTGQARPHLSTPALKAMWERGWLPRFRGSWAEAQKKADQLLDRFFSFGKDLGALPALARQKVHGSARKDEWALLAWKTRVLQRATSENIATEFDAGGFPPSVLKHIGGLSRLPAGPTVAVDLLKTHGVAVVTERHLPGTFLDGAALLLEKNRPVIGLTLRYDRLDHFWFTLFHELGHVVKHLARGKAEGFIDDLELPPTDKC